MKRIEQIRNAARYKYPDERIHWGFEHGLEYALTKVGWHPGSKLPAIPKDEDSVWVYCLVYGKGTDGNVLVPMCVEFTKLLMLGWRLSENIIVKWWCYPPKED